MVSLLSRLPKVRGRYRENADLGGTTWFRVGGPAEVLFKPEDTDDLSMFLKERPKDIPVTVIGVGSNLLVRDGGIPGVVIRLGRNFAMMEKQENAITVGAACLDLNVAKYAAMHGIGGLEFLSGIPGTIGGALKMNAGSYDQNIAGIAGVLVEAQAVDNEGNIHTVTPQDIAFSYRHSATPEGWIYTQAVLKGRTEDSAAIFARMDEIQQKREASQPIRTCTGGSTFKNPTGQGSDTKKAWQLVDEAGCRGLRVGGAQVSELHCNFLINTGNATAADIESLGEEVRKRVKARSGIELEWEIKRVGVKG